MEETKDIVDLIGDEVEYLEGLVCCLDATELGENKRNQLRYALQRLGDVLKEGEKHAQVQWATSTASRNKVPKKFFEDVPSREWHSKCGNSVSEKPNYDTSHCVAPRHTPSNEVEENALFKSSDSFMRDQSGEMLETVSKSQKSVNGVPYTGSKTTEQAAIPPGYRLLDSVEKASVIEATQKPTEKNKKIVVAKNKSGVTRESMHTLEKGEWVDDDTVNAKLGLVNKRSRSRKNLPHVLAMKECVFTYLYKVGCDGIEAFFDRDDIEQLSVASSFIFPIHDPHPGHWTLAVANVETAEITYYDSNSEAARSSCGYNSYEERWKEKLQVIEKLMPKLLNMNITWKKCIYPATPQQDNGDDCGVFMMTIADYVSTGQKPDFGQEHIPYLRDVIALEIIKDGLLRNVPQTRDLH